MKGNIFAIMKKELDRFFGDRRMVISTLLVPGLMIYLIYSFMGSAITEKFTPDENKLPVIAAVNLPEEFLSSGGAEYEEIDEEQIESVKTGILAGESRALVVFPENFIEAAKQYDVSQSASAPMVGIFYNPTNADSSNAQSFIESTLTAYETSLSNKFDVSSVELANSSDATGMIMSSMLPMLLMIFMFSGCVAVAPESIAGEKERGTIATLLVTPLRRRELAMGKIFSLAIIAFLSGISSSIGTLLSLPKLMGGASEAIDVGVYAASDYLSLALIIISTVLLLITVISIVSAFARTVKEATTAVMPLMIVNMLVGVSAMFGGGAKEELAYYFIPLYNSVQCMVGVFSFEAQPYAVAVTVAANIAFAAIGTFVLTRMFGSEKVMFSK